MSVAPDVLVAGAGVIGLAIARELAHRGRSVLVVEPDAPARQASWAAAGMLSPLGEAASHGPLHELAEASLDRWPTFAAALHAESGIDAEYREGGALHVAFDDFRAEALRDTLMRADARAGARMLGAVEARALEPALTPALHSALFIGRDHRVNNRRLLEALRSAASNAGVDFVHAARVERIDCEGATDGSSRFATAHLAPGGPVAAGALVVAAGAWSRSLRGLPTPLPVRPVRGQMFSISTAADAPLIGRAIVTPDCYLVPREGGQVLVGATVEDVGFAPGPTPAGLASLISAAVRVVPAIAQLPVSEIWSGFRPGTPDGLPVLGADPSSANVFHATGHFRNGILLTPLTAELIADVVEGRAPALSLDPFSIARFG